MDNKQNKKISLLTIVGCLIVILIGAHIALSGKLRNFIALGEERYIIGGTIIVIGLWGLVYGYISSRNEK